jgi:hypothetical protein
MPAEKRFRVALSFPGERRSFVGQVAEHLARAVGRDRVLYDEYCEAEFARPDLDTYLQRLYHDESELVVLFVDADYERKEWCGLEWRAIRDLLKLRQIPAIMLVRFDNTEIPGLFSIDGYVWVAERTPEGIAELILHRVETNAGGARAVARSEPAKNSISGSAVRAMWKKKLEFLLVEEARASDPAQRFQLRELIDEAKAKIREFGGAA